MRGAATLLGVCGNGRLFRGTGLFLGDREIRSRAWCDRFGFLVERMFAAGQRFQSARFKVGDAHLPTFVDHHQAWCEQYQQSDIQIPNAKKAMEYEIDAQQQKRSQENPSGWFWSLVIK